MSLSAPVRCSALAEELGEPMIGTVKPVPRWLLVEDRGLWGHDAVTDLLGREAAAAAKAGGMKVLLVRQREGDPAEDASRRVILVDTSTGEMANRAIADLSELAVPEAATQPVAAFGAALPGPLFLVCTNGKRDACCALRGRALMAALAERHADCTWESTHLGGHRFAGNLVCLPDGIVYGRVAPAEGPRLADAYVEGLLDPALLRGRASWPMPAQVAEAAVRERLGLWGVGEVALVRASLDGERAEVVLAAGGAEHRVLLRREASTPERITSCRADELETPMHWVLA